MDTADPSKTCDTVFKLKRFIVEVKLWIEYGFFFLKSGTYQTREAEMNKFERSPSLGLNQKQIQICAKSNDLKGFLFAQQLGTELLRAIRGCRGRS